VDPEFGLMDIHKARALSDLELLEVEMDLLWGSEGGPELVLACGRDGVRARISNRVRPEVALRLATWIEQGAPAAEDLGALPVELERCRVALEDELDAAVRLMSGSGPSYLIEPGVSFRATAELIRSDSGDPAQLRASNPGHWGADEWHDLLDGRLGPWVMTTHGERVISIFHTPVANASAADAGVWTHPEFRGHGHAAAATADWAALMRTSGRQLFYRTSRTNLASQRVAARLGLRRIGYLWQLQSMNTGAGWTDPRVRAGPSTIAGNRLYASAPFRAGEIVFVWGGGTIISDAELHAVIASGRRNNSVGVDENQHILWGADDPDAGGPGGVSHSCDSNLCMLDARTVGARRDIAVGEELTLDYALFSVAPDWHMDCHCGSSLCRGIVTGKDWRSSELQERYAGHFSPFINARIAKLYRL
jgi:RimJ/RimL family protein N-acetyltransferase